MSEKRFTVIIESKGFYDTRCWLNDSENEIKDISDNGYDFRDDVKGAKMFCELLNNLHEENIQLKGELSYYKLLLMSLEKEAKRLSQIKR